MFVFCSSEGGVRKFKRAEPCQWEQEKKHAHERGKLREDHHYHTKKTFQQRNWPTVHSRITIKITKSFHHFHFKQIYSFFLQTIKYIVTGRYSVWRCQISYNFWSSQSRSLCSWFLRVLMDSKRQPLTIIMTPNPEGETHWASFMIRFYFDSEMHVSHRQVQGMLYIS